MTHGPRWLVIVLLAAAGAMLAGTAGSNPASAATYVYDGGETPTSAAGATSSCLPGHQVVHAGLERDRTCNSGYDPQHDPARTNAPPGPGFLAPQTARAGVRRPGPGTPHIDDFANRRLADLPSNAQISGDFDDVARNLARNHGVPRDLASERLHAMKRSTGRGGADNLLFDRTGGVWDPVSGEYIGSLTQGGGRP